MVDSMLLNDENVLSLARKVKDIDGVLRVTWQTILDNKQKEKYGANGICILVAVYGNDSTEEEQTYRSLPFFVAEAVHSNPENHQVILDGVKDLIVEYKQKK
jgi:hypothetical protein